jgi:hypothetical protein
MNLMAMLSKITNNKKDRKFDKIKADRLCGPLLPKGDKNWDY